VSTNLWATLYDTQPIRRVDARGNIVRGRSRQCLKPINRIRRYILLRLSCAFRPDLTADRGARRATASSATRFLFTWFFFSRYFLCGLLTGVKRLIRSNNWQVVSHSIHTLVITICTHKVLCQWPDEVERDDVKGD